MNWMVKLTQIDRRWIFLLVAFFVTFPQIYKVGLPLEPVPPVKSIFNYIEELPEGSRIFIAFDYDPASEAELYPMSLAILRHAFEKKLRVLTCTLWVTGKGILSRAFTQMEKEYDITHGVDYADFGYQVGAALVIIQSGKDFAKTFPRARTLRTEDMEITKGVKKMQDIDYVMDLAAGASVDWWVAYGKEAYGYDLGAGCTAVSATQYYPYLNTGQLNGLIGGLKGAAEYEKLVDENYSKKTGRSYLGLAMSGMSSQSFVHILIVFLVIITNIFYFLTKKST